MSRYLHDSEGDSLRIEKASPPYEGAMLSASQRDSGGTVHHAIIGPIDPRALIEAIKAEFELHEDDEVHDTPAAPFSSREAARLLRYAEDARAGGEKIPVDPEVVQNLVRAIFPDLGEEGDSSVVEAVAEQINDGQATLSFEEAVGRRSNLRTLDEEIDARAAKEEKDAPLPPETFPRSYVHTMPATAEEPRLWAGSDEPVIDSLIGRVADLEDEKERTEAHQHLAEHWNRRLEVVRTALSMLPAPGKRGGMLAAFAGEETPDPLRVENALKIARFAADEDRDIPGVDR